MTAAVGIALCFCRTVSHPFASELASFDRSCPKPGAVPAKPTFKRTLCDFASSSVQVRSASLTRNADMLTVFIFFVTFGHISPIIPTIINIIASKLAAQFVMIVRFVRENRQHFSTAGTRPRENARLGNRLNNAAPYSPFQLSVINAIYVWRM